MKFTLVALAGLALAGCAQTVWVRDGATHQDYATDSYECERDMRQGGYYGSGLAGAINMQGFMNRCMVARGWRQTNAQSGGTPPGASDMDARFAASRACEAAGIKPDDRGYYACFQSTSVQHTEGSD